MTETEMKAATLESPALKKQSTDKGKFAYPARYNGKVPLKVKMLHTVTSDLPFGNREDVVCAVDMEYYVNVNSYGAISAILKNGERLGLKSNEFEVIEFHP
jgi:hypothetical protein